MPSQTDLLKALRESYNEVVSAKKFEKLGRIRVSHVSNVRRYLLYMADLLSLYLRIQRDRDYQRNGFYDDWY